MNPNHLVAIKKVYQAGWEDSAKRNCHLDCIDDNAPQNVEDGIKKYFEELSKYASFLVCIQQFLPRLRIRNGRLFRR
jgi:hypothetical protein